ncbi:hypothetical protein [Pseudomonas sp. CNPSo 3701]|uniref:hypothetical protein n=1 Tax=Pseudomonas sp. CNPSo 3701 TaxID=3027943 RepID=UPI002363232E|nr:hypothetical protein [Pseudomonas sp. CNPSo 3701]MDD1506007.1 hypothetical protein [Pseudomonas sp. CNPSo 3701]
MKFLWRICACLLLTLSSPAIPATPAHGLEAPSVGRAISIDEVNAFLDRGRRFFYKGKQFQPVGDWYQRNSRYYLLGDDTTLLAVGTGKEIASYDYFKPGTQLIRLHETGVPVAIPLSTFTMLGWPQSNPDLRVFPQFGLALSASTGELRKYSVAPYGSDGVLLVAPDLSRAVSRSAYGPVVLMEPGKGLIGMIWPDERTLKQARQEIGNEVQRIEATGRYAHGSESGLFGPYAKYQWVNKHLRWYRVGKQWHLRGLGKTTEPEPLSSDFYQFLQSYYRSVVETGEPLPWRNFRAGHPGVTSLPVDDPRLLPPCDCGVYYHAGNQLPLAFALNRPLKLFGVNVDAFGLSGEKLKPRLYTRVARDSILSAMTRHFASQGLRMEQLNGDHHVIRGGAVKLFVRVYRTADPNTQAIDIASRGAFDCLECYGD